MGCLYTITIGDPATNPRSIEMAQATSILCEKMSSARCWEGCQIGQCEIALGSWTPPCEFAQYNSHLKLKDVFLKTDKTVIAFYPTIRCLPFLHSSMNLNQTLKQKKSLALGAI